MSNTTTTAAANLQTVKAIGRGIRLTEQAVPQIVAMLPADFDPKARGAVAEIVHVWACGDRPADQRPAVKTGPKGEQTTTDYGRGHDTLVKAVKRALSEDKPKPIRMAVTLSGEGAPATGTVTIDPSDPLFAVLVARIAGDDAAAA